MRFIFGLAVAALLVFPPQALRAQDLAPRAYVITPIHSNAVLLTWSYYDGSINFNGTLPISDAKGKYSVPIYSYYHSFNFLGRSANIVAALPYGVGNFRGTVSGGERQQYRSGLVDSVYRLSVNLKGGPAMQPRDFIKWQQKMLLGVGLKVMAPTGQYDPTRVIGNRWRGWALRTPIGGRTVTNWWGHYWRERSSQSLHHDDFRS